MTNTYVWKNPTGGGDWNTAGNWKIGGATAAASPGTTDIAQVPTSSGIITATGTTFGAVTFSSASPVTPSTAIIALLPDNTMRGTGANAYPIPSLGKIAGGHTFTLNSGTLELGPDHFNGGAPTDTAGNAVAYSIGSFGTLADNSVVLFDQTQLDPTTTGQTISISPSVVIGSGAVHGLFTAANGTFITFGAALTINMHGTLDIEGDQATTGGMTATSLINAGTLIVANTASAEIKTSLTNQSGAVIRIDGFGGLGSMLTLDGAVSISNAGTFTLSNSGTLEITGTMLTPTGTVAFLDDAGNSLRIDANNAAPVLATRITGFINQTNDTIDFAGFAFDRAADTLIASGNTLDIVTNDGTIAELVFADALNPINVKAFSLQDDGSGMFGGIGGTALTAVACFAPGTRIMTPCGPKPIERIAVGDIVLTATDSGSRTVIWTGRRHVCIADHLHPQDFWPIRVLAGAIAPGCPSRDLVLSPDHALHDQSTGTPLLIPVRFLINGLSIVQEPADEMVWHHIELDAHDAILAEGTAAESYLDTGNRHEFESSVALVDGFADLARQGGQQEPCASITRQGPVLEIIYQRLLCRAEALGIGRAASAEQLAKAC